MPSTAHRRPLVLVLAAVAALVLAACETTAGDFTARQTQVNAARAGARLRPVDTQAGLADRADAWARQLRDDWVRAGCPSGDLIARGILRHSNLGAHYGSVGGWTNVGENVGWAPVATTRAAALDALQAAYMASATHRAIILDGRYNKAGFALVWGPTPAQKAAGMCPSRPVGSAAFSTDAFGEFR